MHAFTYQAHPARVSFGAGVLAELGEALARLSSRRALVLSTPGQEALARRAMAAAGDRAVAVHAHAALHVPLKLAEAARAAARAVQADALVAIGGGSTVGLAKAVALDGGLPIVAVPTTYAGSEMTPIWGLTEGGVKRTGRDARVLPQAVLYDPELSRGLPWPVTVTSAFNAMAHAAEGLYAPDVNPLLAAMAEEGLRTFARALPALAADPQAIDARADALAGAWLCGGVLGATTMGLHHKLCHTLGGSFDLPHAEVHTVVLPHALAYNAPAAPRAMARTARALGLGPQAEAEPLAAARALQAMAAGLGAPASLASLGLPAGQLDRAADLAVANPYANPRALERGALRALLARAHAGAPVQA